MKYLLIICHDDAFVPTETLISDIGDWIKAMKDRKIRRDGNPLRPARDAMTVRVRNGKPKITQGPFADSKEKICAYELLECANINEAIDASSQHPMAKAATIEVRPIWSQLVE